jgi:hypothetical protein
MTPDPLLPPQDLIARISTDLAPVKPAPLPARVAARLAPFLLLAPLAVLALIGLRRDTAALGPLVAWGASLSQFALAIVLLWIAARENTPSRRLPRSVVRFALVAVAVLAIAFALWTFAVTPPSVRPARNPWINGVICGLGGTLFGGLLVALFGWSFRRSLTARPALIGALYGAGAGITVNAGWRLACPVSTPWHTLLSHGGSIVLVTLLGALVAQRFARRRG